MKIDRINASLILTIINELLQSLVIMESYATTRSEKVKRLILFLTCSLDLDHACASVRREAILSRRLLVKNFAFSTCLLTYHVREHGARAL